MINGIDTSKDEELARALAEEEKLAATTNLEGLSQDEQLALQLAQQEEEEDKKNCCR